ncbi:CehA/McbA family metallohydrolase [Halegenticoccus tardaugens]|uniref:CehA/McbA family metallohydrolase n=1 Tax=Halegenticoccus tardaugens TaxID=2071624 RepID=UPI00100B3AB5|nr:PHP domain-containing protein [Halegenticoccus tardaugens]
MSRRTTDRTPDRRPPRSVVRIDPHVHTADSYDSEESVERVLDRARAVDLDGVVVTDHDAIGASRRAAALASSYGLLGLPGVEVSTADGHLLALGVDRVPEPGHPLSETLATVRSLGGVGVAPHPFQRLRHGVRASAIDACGDRLDGIEAYNAHTVTGVRNAQAAAFADERGYPQFGGSDAHRAELVGRGYTEVAVDDPTDPTAVLAAMRAGRTRGGGSRISVGGYVKKYARNARLKTLSGLRAVSVI